MTHPIEKFKTWYNEEITRSTVRIPSACCLSSLGTDGFPNARFVSLKDILGHKFVITGPLNSRKGIELLANPKAALTFWWTETERQIRIQGEAVPIEDELANTYFKERNRDSQIVSQICQQGLIIEDKSTLINTFEQLQSNPEQRIEKPKDWSGFYIIPKRIEFMVFKQSRFHSRELYTNRNGHWETLELQP